MGYKIAVCIKHVPDPEQFSKIKLDPDTGTIIRTGIPSVVNPLDLYALEAAINFKEQHGGSVLAVTMGPAQAKEALEIALAMGADEACLISDKKFAGADTLVTAEILAKGIQAIGFFDLVICGDIAVDGSTGQVPAQLAEFLGWPHVSHVAEMQLEEEKMRVKSTRETGYMVYEVQFPMLLSVNKRIGEPRIITVQGIMKAVKYDPRVLTADQIPIDMPDALAGSPTRVAGMSAINTGRRGLILQDEPGVAVKKAIEHLKKLGVF